MGRIAGVSPDETRDRLLAAAAEVFLERGFGDANVSDIARRAGFTTGAIYGRFRGKAELLAETVRDHSLDAIYEVFESGTQDLLQAIGRASSPSEPDALLLEAIVAARRDSDLAQWLSSALTSGERLLAVSVRRAQADGRVDPRLAPEAVARLCTVLAVGGTGVQLLGLEPIDQQDWTYLLERMHQSLASPASAVPDQVP